MESTEASPNVSALTDSAAFPESGGEPRHWWGAWKFWAWLLVVELAVYFLSAGPMYWRIYEAYVLDGSKAVATFYYPLLWASSNIKPVGDLLNLYLTWWVL